MYVVFIVIILFSVFLNDPGPDRILSPAGTTIQLNCSINPVQSYVIQWQLKLPDRIRPFYTDTGNAVEILVQRGITVQGAGTQTSSITFSGQERNSQTTVKCAAISHESTSRILGEAVDLIIYG